MALPTGGPGWFNDIFVAKLEFEKSCYTLVADEHAKMHDGKDEQIKLFDGKGAISGKLQITPPEGRDINHNGIEISFNSQSITFGAANPPGKTILKKWTLLEAGSINEPIEIGFDIDLSELNLRDTFVGANMSFAHSVAYRIVRPWYTFSVRGEERIAIVNCTPKDAPPPPPTEHVLCLDDFGGLCTFDHGKCVFAADGAMVGVLRFTDMKPGTSLSEVALLLGRTEQWSTNEGCDATVRYHLLHTSDMAPITCDCDIAVDISLDKKGSELDGVEGPLPPTMLPLTPDDEDCDKATVPSVTYWVRILLATTPADSKEKPKSHWSTHPILLLPSTDSGVGGI